MISCGYFVLLKQNNYRQPAILLCSLSMLKKKLWACEIGLWKLNKKRCTKSWPPFSSTLPYTDNLAFLHCTSPPRWSAYNKKRLTLGQFLEVSAHDCPCCFTLVAWQCVTKRVCVRGMGVCGSVLTTYQSDIEMPFRAEQCHNLSVFAFWPVEGPCVNWILFQGECFLMRVLRCWVARGR